jgi:large repetitive protein
VAITLTGTDIDGDMLSFEVASGPSNGGVVISGSTATYTPNANYHGPDSFTFVAKDPLGAMSDPAPVDITVNPVNDAPTANAGSATTDEDNPVTITLTGADVEGDALTFALAVGPSQGSVVVSGTTATYTPNPDYHGPDSFTFVAKDTAGAVSDPAQVSITVNPVNDAPTANAGSATTDEDTAVTITLTGADIDGDMLSFEVASAPSNGNVVISGSTATYTPNADYHGPDSFTFVAKDPAGALSDPAPVNITVNPVNDAPTADDQSVTTDEDTALGIALTGADVEGDALTYAVASAPSHGNVVISGSTATYTPNANYHGPDSFTFVVEGHRGRAKRSGHGEHHSEPGQ